MNEFEQSRPELRRVTIDVAPEVLPELLGQLGKIAALENVAVRISDIPAQVEQANEIDKSKYKEGMVEWLVDKESGQEIPVITPRHIDEFMAAMPHRFRYNKGMVTRTFNQLYWANENFGRKRTYEEEKLSNCLYEVEPRKVFIRAEKAADLGAELSSGRLDIRSLGYISAFLIEEYAKAMLKAEPATRSIFE